jgi:phasin family protein
VAHVHLAGIVPGAPWAYTAQVHAQETIMSSSQPENPFAQAMTQAKSAAEDFTKMFAEMKLPAMPDAEALLAAQRRNMEALTTANRIAMEGAQAVAKRHMEIMQQTLAEVSEQIRALSGTEAPSAKAARQAELLKQSYEHAVANAKELADLIQRANADAIGALNRRFMEAMDEVKQLAAKTGK